MKAKLKSANGLVRFLLNHGEKLGMLAVLAVAGLLIAKSLGREKLGDDKQPAQLEASAGQAREKVQNMKWDDLPEEEATSYERYQARSGELKITLIDSKDFPKIEINPPVIEPMKLRADPVLIAVEDLEVNPGSGLWMSSDPATIRKNLIEAAKKAAAEAAEAKAEADRMAEETESGGRGGRDGDEGRGPEGFGDMGGMMKTKDGAIVVQPRGGAQMQGYEDIRERSWVTVLAKAPIKQQFQMYEDALAGAGGFNLTNDQPEYWGYIVERAEITEEGQGKWMQLTPVRGPGIIKVMSTWPMPTPDLVTPKYIHPLLTFPLPPMVMRAWGHEITHSEMPIQTAEELMEEQQRELEEANKPEEEQAEDPDSPFAGAIRRGTQPMMGGLEGEFSRGGLEGRAMGRPSMYGGGMEGGLEGGRGGGMPGGGRSGGPTELPPYSWDFETKYLLFRYFDSTVAPGHRYRYRVRVAMIDVNALQIPKYLAPEVSARLEQEKAAAVKAKKPAEPKGFRLSEWSEPSPIAVVPQSGLAYLAGAKPPSQNNLNSEPEARVVVKSLDSEFAAETAIGDWFTRGSVLNRTQNAQIIWSSLLKPDPAGPVETPEFDFATGLTLVDFDGGEEMTPKNKKLLAPARALVMDSAGRMMTRDELAEKNQLAVREYDYVIEASKLAAQRARQQSDGRGEGRGRGE